uniref:Subtilisin-like protease n=3 Tax=Oryza TaxID=4527 RepID=C0JA17_ORYGL|nr:subtilisin-like protease precursor [Oryza glaberrima]
MVITTAMSARSMSTRLELLVVFVFIVAPALAATKPSYIVYLGGRHSHGDDGGVISLEEAHRTAAESHYDLLGSVLGDREKARDAIFYSYTKNINGFAARLEAEEAAAVAERPGVVSVFPDRGRRMHTTRSWQFLGLERPDGSVPPWSPWEAARYGQHIIIGNLDSGVWPESLSFNDRELGPIPNYWKGACRNEHDKTFKCNSKLIGARYFNNGYAKVIGVPLNDTHKTPRDGNGHGTLHVGHRRRFWLCAAPRRSASSAASARGGSPRARVAAYRVCYPPFNGSDACYDSDILAAFEAAIADGVHVISASVGADPNDYLEDAIAIGALHAVKAGITVVCSASNFGPDPGTVTNVAPWILTVAASTMDRAFPAHLVFNRNRVEGQSLSPTWLRGKTFYTMISAANAAVPGYPPADALLCELGALDGKKVMGKIVVCMRGGNPRVEKGEEVSRAGGAAMILVNDEASGNDVIADAHVLPAVHINHADGHALLAYINSTKGAKAFITRAKTVVGVKPAPVMAAFSSQGPNTVNPEILKPDVTAPGVSVIAAWSGAAGPTGLPYDQRRVAFNAQSGTSMSCPQVSGVAGLIKTLHPDWSPAAIKSAIMTTATELGNDMRPIMNSSMSPATPFSCGAGHVFPHRAMDPGLVYDLTVDDHLSFLCTIGYNATALALFNGAPFRCPDDPLDPLDFNYPSITAFDLAPAGPPATARRRVRNVGPPATYTAAVVREPEGVQVTVTPTTLTFESTGEVRTFWVKFAVRDPAPAANYAFGAIVWSDGNHQVRSPIVVKTQES